MTTTPHRNIMREFKIAEISCVDNPAQEHARMTIMKRDDRQENQQMDIAKVASFDHFEAAVAAIAKREGLPTHAAMSMAARAYPELVQKYRQAGDERIAKATERLRGPTVSPAVTQFQELISRIAERDKCDSVSAMRRARAENPQLFEAYQAA